jgi:hypothetical protein
MKNYHKVGWIGITALVLAVVAGCNSTAFSRVKTTKSADGSATESRITANRSTWNAEAAEQAGTFLGDAYDAISSTGILAAVLGTTGVGGVAYAALNSLANRRRRTREDAIRNDEYLAGVLAGRAANGGGVGVGGVGGVGSQGPGVTS